MGKEGTAHVLADLTAAGLAPEAWSRRVAEAAAAARAEPIALRFETGQAKLAGHFPAVEDQLCALTWSGYQGAGSPDRADAMVWAMTELFGRGRAVSRVRVL